MDMACQTSARHRSHRLQQGLTLIEVIAGLLISSMVLTVVLLLHSFAIVIWSQAERAVTAASNAAQGVNASSSSLLEAMEATVAADGRSVTFTAPRRGTDGKFLVPVTPEATTRSIYLSDNQLILQVGTTTRVIARNVRSTDPGTGATYRIFTAGPEILTREITIQLYCTSSDTAQSASSYASTVVRIRNPQ